MASITLPLGRLGQAATLMAKALEGKVAAGIVSASQRARVIMRDQTILAPPANPAGKGTGGAVNTGFYLRAWKADALVPQRAVHIYNQAPYAGVIEYGRRAGARTPPREVIARWAQRKLGLPYKEAWRAAYPIMRAIARRGLRDRKVLFGDSTQTRLREMFLEEILREVGSDLRLTP